MSNLQNCQIYRTLLQILLLLTILLVHVYILYRSINCLWSILYLGLSVKISK